MGRGIIIIILGVSLITAFLILKLNANSKEGLKTTIDYYELTQARLVGTSGIEIYLEKLRRNKSLTGTFKDISLMNGSYDISIVGPDSSMTITSTGYFGNTSHQSIVTAKREPATVPPIHGAMYVSSDNLSLNLNGNMDIDGNDRNIDDSPGPNPPLPGIAVDDPSDSAYVINDLKSKINDDIKGFGGPPSVRTTTDATNWDEVTQNLIFAADYTLPTGTYSTGTVLGKFAEPKITYVNGDVQLSGTASGAGIMVINGDLTMSGDFKYYGIVIVYGKSSIKTQIVGNGGIYGSTILIGQNVDIQSTGNSAFYYSSQAITNAQVNLKSSRFQILSWWE